MSNVDLKPVLSIYVTIKYVAKYVSKAKTHFLAFSDILEKALHDNIPDNPALKVFQKLLLHTVAEHDFFA